MHSYTHSYSVKITQSKAAVSRAKSGHGGDLVRLTLADSHLTFLSTIPGHEHSTHTHQCWSIMNQILGHEEKDCLTGPGPRLPNTCTYRQKILKEDWFSFHGHYNINRGIQHSLLSTRKSFRLNNSFNKCQDVRIIKVKNNF